MPKTSVVRSALLEGTVTSIPTHTPVKTQFAFQVTRLNQQPCRATLWLSCSPACDGIHVGEHGRVTATLRRARNFSNPGGFDYVRWLAVRHLHWQGFVVTGTWQRLSDRSSGAWFLRWRERLGQVIEALHPYPETQGIVEALTLGLTSHIDPTQWALFRRTGTTHLMVISGAHIGLVAGLVYSAVKKTVCCFGVLCLRVPAQKIARSFSLMASLMYALLAGFAVPAQRAFMMTLFVLMRTVSSKRFTSWQSFRYALLAVVMFEPHAVLMPGFYLSFLAVACLMVTHQRYALKGFRNVLLLQCACLIGLMPLTLFWFSYGAVNGLLANLLAIPWVGFVVVPLSLMLLGIHLPWLSQAVHWAVWGLLHYLNWIDSLSMVNLTQSFSSVLSPIGLMMALYLMMMLPWSRWCWCVCCLVIGGVWMQTDKIKKGDVRMDVLDVGQGLSVVVRTAAHTLVYDTGMQFYHGSNMGAMVIVPYLKHLGVKKVDRIVISHPDLDHRGGLNDLDAAYPGAMLLVNDPGFYQRGKSCHRESDWVWEGVRFHFFPLNDTTQRQNNRSCVLQIQHPSGSLLLTGDIEHAAEEVLRKRYGAALASTVMVVPHHGSQTSSSLAFVKRVHPRFVMVSYGLDNRYRFPHKKAMSVYQELGIPVYNTVACGMLSVVMSLKSEYKKPYCYNNGLFGLQSL